MSLSAIYESAAQFLTTSLAQLFKHSRGYCPKVTTVHLICTIIIRESVNVWHISCNRIDFCIWEVNIITSSHFPCQNKIMPISIYPLTILYRSDPVQVRKMTVKTCGAKKKEKEEIRLKERAEKEGKKQVGGKRADELRRRRGKKEVLPIFLHFSFNPKTLVH